MVLLRIVAVLGLALLAGCGVLGSIRTPVSAPQPAIDQDRLLSIAAACHLMRVGQTSDPSVTDATVIAATRQYGFSIDDVRARSSALLRISRSRQEVLARSMAVSCQRLAGLTGVQSDLARIRQTASVKANWVRVSGEIKEGYADRVIAQIRGSKAVGVIVDSPGGSVNEARRLGRYLRSQGLSAAVDKSCLSACVDVLAGGVERYVTTGAVLGIHQSKVPRGTSSHEGGQSYVAGSALYLREMGVDASVALVAAGVPHDKIFLISTANALSTRLATKVIRSL